MIRWTKELENELVDKWQDYSDEELGKMFGGTWQAINAKRRRLGLLRAEKHINNTRQYTYDEVVNIFDQNGLKLVSEEYTNYTTPLLYVCKTHESQGVQKIKFCDLLRNRGCYYCGRDKTINASKHPDEYYIEECKKRNMVFVERIMRNKRSVIRYICNQHQEVGVQEKDISNFEATHNCPYCKASKGETKLREILDRKGYKYISQKRFNDCKDKHTLPFDFYLYNENILIEYDGIQHFEPTKWFRVIIDEQAEKDFQSLKHRDEIKNKYCKDNGIPLIRIPYWEYDNMESFLDSELNKYI